MQVEMPENLSLFLDAIILPDDFSEYDYVSGIINFIDAEGNIITTKNRTTNEENLTIDDLIDFYNVPLTDGSNIYLRVEGDMIDVIYDGRIFSFGFSNDLYDKNNRKLRYSSSDEFFQKWKQFRITLKSLNNLSQKDKIIAKVKDFLLLGIGKMKEQLQQCKLIKRAYDSGNLSTQQLKELDVKKLTDNLNELPKQIKEVDQCIQKIGTIFRVFDIAAIIYDINKAEESLHEWNDIIDNIESTNCWEMVELDSKAKFYRQAVAVGYNTNFTTRVAICVGVDKLLGELMAIIMESGALGGEAAALATTAEGGAAASAAMICAVVSQIIVDASLIQGGVNQWNDIRWKHEISMQIPVLKGKCNDDDDDNKPKKKIRWWWPW